MPPYRPTSSTGSPPGPKPGNRVSEVTRRDIVDELRLTRVDWAGRLDEVKFLSRIFDLSALPSNDPRNNTMEGDVGRHRVWWGEVDWEDDWVYDDARLDLLQCPDDVFLNFLCQMVHPIVREDSAEALALAELFSRHLKVDGYEIAAASNISGKPVFVGRPLIGGFGAGANPARPVADGFASEAISAQITRMETAVRDDPALAIGSAKEFLETVSKGVLSRLGVEVNGREDLPRLVHMARQALELDVGRSAEETLKRTLGSLATLTQGVAELRGQMGTGHGPHPEARAPTPAIARLAVGSAVTLGVFLFETYSEREAAGPRPADPA